MNKSVPVKSSWKNHVDVAPKLKSLNALVHAEILEDGKKLTVEHILNRLLGPDLFAFEPVSPEGYEVLFKFCGVKRLDEHKEVPEEGSWPLYITKLTHGPITIHCRPERTSLEGVLFKMCQVQDMFNTEDDFRAIRERVSMVNARLSSLADRNDEKEQEQFLLASSDTAVPFQQTVQA